ncbi:TetR/AcrR family transcriptional regulator [Arthrobacter cryoconiti]|uniref:TetR/AcrR family transcriptional regulator n=1 Tax=Arthrobacter cryoconiti TaxID=748907 RepID=A0ABV8QY78_9MICC|nr:TetR/AcrR family transcriptional regulator [Arthrobacter cryoconiti]MCC9068203.1 TetR/AcrR family transcriptional regulator [Arthrobacter cryoconiti]
MSTQEHPISTRERFREQMREEVKEIASEQLLEGGPQGISLNAIAKRLAVSGSALYRYYSNRDELLGALVIDAYTDLRDALAADAASNETGQELIDRVRSLARAYRDWARQQPHRYELLFKPPLPGYDAHSAPLAEAARSLMGVILGVLAGRRSGQKAPAHLANDEVLTARGAGSEDYELALRLWSRLHGLVSLEIGGAYSAMHIDADALFEHEVKALAA